MEKKSHAHSKSGFTVREPERDVFIAPFTHNIPQKTS
jgi:hypothetical protein